MSSKANSEEKKNNKSGGVAQKNDASMKPSTSQSTASTSASTSELCVAEGCKNLAVSHPEWDNEYCSVDCCYNHCKNTFKAWLAANKAAKIKTDAAAEECVAGPSKQ